VNIPSAIVLGLVFLGGLVLLFFFAVVVFFFPRSGGFVLLDLLKNFQLVVAPASSVGSVFPLGRLFKLVVLRPAV